MPPRPDGDGLQATGTGYALRLVGVRSLEHRLQFGGTTVGGLSGIDYDPAADLYYLVSDDRSRFSPARFYTARLAIDDTGFHDVALQAVVPLRTPAGEAYPPDTVDAEAIRFDTRTGRLWWTSEGGRSDDRVGTRIDPFVRAAEVDGGYAGAVPVDPRFRWSDEARGPRHDLTFEGLALSPDGRSLWIAMEGPLRQDGQVPTMAHGALVRFSRHDRAAGAGSPDFGPLALQYAYPVDAIPSRGAWTRWHAQNGVSEVLALDSTRLLVLERALVLGPVWRIRLYEADTRGASDVAGRDALVEADGTDGGLVPMTKRLVLDFDTLGIAVDNLEGLCFGPTLANGHRTLVLVSDDNFNPGQTTQFVVLEMVPR